MKSTLTKFALAVTAALALSSGVAMASHRHHHHHGGSSFYGNVGGVHFGYSRGGYGYGGGYGGGYGYGYQPIYRAPVWHDTSHYHYTPSSVVPHGDHYHVLPGHYDLHRSGHWHY